MNWPLPQDINEAVQNPGLAFSDPDLAAGSIDVGPLGVPLPRSGGFADVYRIHGADGRDWAVKCFTRPVPGLQDRYAAIDHYLAQAALPFCVGFSYLPEGLRVRGGEFPILKMPWVEGFPLNEFVSQNLGRLNVLESLMAVWGRMCRRLRESGLAHADIQHGNVILVPGTQKSLLSVRLVDYDGMFVPALSGRPPAEYGHPSYQHPDRVAKHVYSGDLDRFPHLVVTTALRGLIVCGPKLWDKYDTGDNVLFTEADFKAPRQSRLMRELWDAQDAGLTGLLAHLAIACTRPIEQTAWLDLIMPEGKQATITPYQEREAAAILGVPVSASVATATPAVSPAVHTGLTTASAMAQPTPLAHPPAVPGMPVMARAVPARPPGMAAPAPLEPQLTFGDDLRAGSRGGSRGISLGTVVVLAGMFLLAAGGLAVYFLRPFELPFAIAPTTEPEQPPPTTSPTDGQQPPPLPVQPPEVPVSTSLPTPLFTARSVWAVKPEELTGKSEPRAARFAPDGKSILLASTGNPGLGLVLSTETGRTVAKFTEHEHPCIAVPGRDGNAFSYGLGQSQIRVWSMADGKPADPIPLPESAASDYSRMMLTLDGTRLLLDGPRRARVLDLKSGKDITPLTGLAQGFLALEPRGGRILSLIPRDKQLVVWNTNGSEGSRVPLATPATAIEAWSPSGRYAALLGFPAGTPPRQNLTVLDITTNQVAKTLGSGYIPGSARYSSSGSFFAAISKAGPVEVWRVDDWALVAVIPFPSPPSAIDLSADGSKIAVTGPGPGVRLYDFGGSSVAGKPVETRPGMVAERWRVTVADGKSETLQFPTVSPDGKSIYGLAVPASGSTDAPTLKKFDGTFGEEQFSAKVGKPGTVPVSLTPTASGRLVLQYPAPIFGPTPIAIVDGRTCESARPTTSVDRKLLDEPRAIDAEARWFAAVYEAEVPTIGVWDLESSSQVATIPCPAKSPPRFLAFSAIDTGAALIVVHSDRVVRLTGAAFEKEVVLNDKLSVKSGVGIGATRDNSRMVLANRSATPGGPTTFSTVDLKTGAIRELARDQKPTSVQILASDRLLLADEAGLTLTDLHREKPTYQAAIPAKPTRVTASADGTVLAVAEGSNLVAYHGYFENPLTTPKTDGRFDVAWVRSPADVGGSPFRSFAVTPKGRVIASVGSRLVTFLPAGPLSTAKPTAPVETLLTAREGAIFALERIPDGDSLRFSSLDLTTGRPAAEGFELSNIPAEGVAFSLSSDGRTLLAANGSHILVWSTKSGRKLWDQTFEDKTISGAAFPEAGKVLILSRAGQGEEFSVYDLDSLRVDRTVSVPDKTIGPISDVDPAAGVMLIHYPDNEENGGNAVDLKTGKVLFPLGKITGKIPPRFSASGRLIVAVSGDKLVILNGRTGRELSRDTLPGPIDSFAMSPEGKYVAVRYTLENDAAELALLKLSDSTTIPEEPVVRRLSVPNEGTIQGALATIKETNKAKYAVTTVTGRKALLDLLLKGANSEKTESPLRYGMFRESLRLATELRDFVQIDTVCGQFAKVFEVDEYDAKADALARLAESHTAAAGARTYADLCEEQAEKALAKGNFDAAIKLLQNASRALKIVTLVKAQAAVEAYIAYLRRAKTRAGPAKDALEPLRLNPDDPDANLALGTFRCVYLGKWDDGVKRLAKSSDPILKSAAIKELAESEDGGFAVGEAWAVAATAATSPDDKAAYQFRARYWFTKAAASQIPAITPKAEAKLAFKSNNFEYKPGLIQDAWGTDRKGVKVTPTKGVIVPLLDFNGQDSGIDRGSTLNIRWTGYLYPPRPGKYKLILNSSDLSNLTVDRVQVIEIPRDRERMTSKDVTLILSEKPILIQIDMIGNNPRRQQLRLTWVPPGGSEELIPAECLIHEKRQESLLTPR